MIGVIYKIYCKDTDISDCYIGSTKNLYNRKRTHKYKSKIDNFKLYKFIRENGGYNNFDYQILEEIYIGDLKQYERKYIENLKPSLNSDIPGRSQKESVIAYRKSTKGIQKEKEYELYYKDIRENRGKQKIKCECGSNLRRDSMNKHLKSNKHKELLNKLIK